MKTIKDVELKLQSFQDDTPKEVLEQMPTYRKLFKAAVGMTIAKDAENAIDLVQLGFHLNRTTIDIQLEDAEFKLLKESCAKNPLNWISNFHGQVMLKLRESE